MSLNGTFGLVLGTQFVAMLASICVLFWRHAGISNKIKRSNTKCYIFSPHVGRFGSSLGVVLGVLLVSKNDALILLFSSTPWGAFWGAFGTHFDPILVSFWDRFGVHARRGCICKKMYPYGTGASFLHVRPLKKELQTQHGFEHRLGAPPGVQNIPVWTPKSFPNGHENVIKTQRKQQNKTKRNKRAKKPPKKTFHDKNGKRG